MSKAIICYFTGTYNTLKAVKLVAEEFGKNEVETELYEIRSTNKEMPDFDAYDYIGFAYPIHGFNAPYYVLDFCKKIQKSEKKRNYFVIKTSGEPLQLNNISSYKMRGILKKRNYVLTNEYHYAMPYNMIFRHSDGMPVKMMNALQVLVPHDVKEILSGEKHLFKYFPFGHCIAWLFRIEHIAMKVNGRFFKVDMDKCIKCMKCVKNCPVENITFDAEKNKFVFGGKCIMCTRCSFNCPKDAFTIGILNGWKVNGAYKFTGEEGFQTGKHKRYCLKAYKKYFARADALREQNDANNN